MVYVTLAHDDHLVISSDVAPLIDNFENKESDKNGNKHEKLFSDQLVVYVEDV